jgi:hypothetical protein
MKRFVIQVAAITVLAASAHAQSLSGIKVEPAAPRVGEKVTITGVFDSAGNPNCNLRVDFGDGKNENFKINQEKDVPLVTTHSYAKAGSYKVSILPRTALPMIKCKGADQTTTVKVVAAAPAAAAAAAKPMAASPTCPAGWTLDAKSVNKKIGSYTCTAKRGTPLPATRIECAAPLGYFENQTKGRLGCQP